MNVTKPKRAVLAVTLLSLVGASVAVPALAETIFSSYNFRYDNLVTWSDILAG